MYKQLGAALELLGARADAIPLYEKALELDQRRVATDPSRSIWRLDLSFAHGALGAALLAQGNVDGARTRYEEAVALREKVVAEDPGEDFAKVALARGYERLAIVRRRLGDMTAALDYCRRRIDVYRDRLAVHPERDNVWNEYSAALFSATTMALDLGETAGTSPAARQTAARAAGGMLDQVAALQARLAPACGTFRKRDGPFASPSPRFALRDREDLVEAVGRTGDDVNADELADAARRRRACIRGRLHRGDVAADDGRDQAGVHLLPADEDDVRGLHHRVRRFDHADQAARFHEAERFAGQVFCHGGLILCDPSARRHRQPLDDLVAVHEPHLVHEVRHGAGMVRDDAGE